MTTESLSENLKGLMRRSHKDMLAMLSVADMSNMQNRTQANMDRMNAQVDAQLKKCLPDYEPPDGGDVGNFTFINAGIFADQQTATALIKAIEDGENGVQQPSSLQPNPVQKPTSEPIQPPPIQPAPQANHVPTTPPLSLSSSLLWDGAMKMLPLLAVAGLSIAAARYFTPKDTDTNSQYSIEAQPYTPESTVPE